MITVVLALGGAVVYGAADFLGGLASRRMRPVVVTALTALVGIVPLLLGLAVVGGRFSGPAVLWGVVVGVSGCVGVLLLYAALAVGPMSVLSPLTAVASGVVPVAVALSRGAVLSPLAVGALVVAVVAVVLVAAVRDPSGARLTVRGVLTALVAGCGFGGIVLAYDATAADSGVAPLLVARVLQAVLLGAAAVVALGSARPGGTTTVDGSAHPEGTVGSGTPGVGGSGTPGVGSSGTPGVGSSGTPGVGGSGAPGVGRSALPTGASRVAATVRWVRPVGWIVVACGVADALANVCIQAALHASADPATLPVVSVLNALYPLGTILLAAVVLRERLTAVQWAGVALALAASVGLALS